MSQTEKASCEVEENSVKSNKISHSFTAKQVKERSAVTKPRSE